LTAETVVGSLEDAEDYKAFEAAVIADYCAETAVARELVLRLASLLWRLRRATAIETDLLAIQAGILPERFDVQSNPQLEPQNADDLDHVAADRAGTTRQLTYSFMRLANLDSGVFERLNRYEAALWRQTVQTLFALHPVRHRQRTSCVIIVTYERMKLLTAIVRAAADDTSPETGAKELDRQNLFSWPQQGSLHARGTIRRAR
jgi:hypothetical protein